MLVLELLTGGDDVPDLAWTPEQRRFWGQAVALALATGLPVSFETHRCRSLYSPWLLGPYLEAFPELRLTADWLRRQPW